MPPAIQTSFQSASLHCSQVIKIMTVFTAIDILNNKHFKSLELPNNISRTTLNGRPLFIRKCMTLKLRMLRFRRPVLINITIAIVFYPIELKGYLNCNRDSRLWFNWIKADCNQLNQWNQLAKLLHCSWASIVLYSDLYNGLRIFWVGPF